MQQPSKKKIFILMPDGVGLRTFAFTRFPKVVENAQYEAVFWNNTPLELSELGLQEIPFSTSKLHPLTDVYKNARKNIELDLFRKKWNDVIYYAYKFPMKARDFKSRIRIALTKYLISRYTSASGLKKIRQRITTLERKTDAYRNSLELLKKEMPSLVFCSNQRHSSAIAPMLAAQDLGIPTATFIFSWDNLPKATMVVECDHYFVWSAFMKQQLLEYYPYITENQIQVCGTTQFESHYNNSEFASREDFFDAHGLDLSRDYICYSGDDITTSPDDPAYLKDVATAVRELNSRGKNLGILYRNCPVDFSDRYDKVIAEFSDVIHPVKPLWKKMGSGWQTVVPTPEDALLLANTARHTIACVNLGSSMVFDFAAHNKPCAYINYNQPHRSNPDWDVHEVYNYMHFRSMPSKEAVVWLSSPTEIADVLLEMIENPQSTVSNAKVWFEKIAMQPANSASERIFAAMQQLIA